MMKNDDVKTVELLRSKAALKPGKSLSPKTTLHKVSAELLERGRNPKADQAPSTRPPQGIRSAELAALGAFEVASPYLLAERALAQRADTAFMMARSSLVALLERLDHAFVVVSSRRHAYESCRTLYFDTLDFSSYRDHLNGARPRQKVRIRHYDHEGASYLEVKTRDAWDITHKQRWVRPFGDETLSFDDIKLLQRATGRADWSEAMGVDFPRVTLVSREQPERLTIDLGLTMGHRGDTVVLPDVMIVELRRESRSQSSRAIKVLRNLGARETQISKYCSAKTLVDGPPPTRARNR